MLHVTDLSFRHGERVLFDRASMALSDGWKVGLEGRNGAAKSTLQRHVQGQIEADGGSIGMTGRMRIGSVPQVPPGGDFPVLDAAGGMMGILSRRQLIATLAEHGPSYPAKAAMEPCERSVSPFMALPEAMERLQGGGCPAVPVIDPDSGRLIGLLTSENVGETLLVRAALRKAGGFA